LRATERINRAALRKVPKVEEAFGTFSSLLRFYSPEQFVKLLDEINASRGNGSMQKSVIEQIEAAL
jgi:hypothetical protein